MAEFSFFLLEQRLKRLMLPTILLASATATSILGLRASIRGRGPRVMSSSSPDWSELELIDRVATDIVERRDQEGRVP